MHNSYNLSYFDPIALENLVRELIQAREIRTYKEPLYIQTYGEGFDGGIDFKFAGKNIYGQSRKCDTDFNHFFESIKSELPKVLKRQPERYFIATNLHLLPHQKNKIQEFFHPYIKSDGDILGRNDLINLLNDYQGIAERYFPSSPELTKVAKESFKVYKKATNENDLFFRHQGFYKGLEILSANSVLIITGTPGIGKSMLARALSYHYKENVGYDDFFYISDAKNAMYNHRVGRKQIFLMDDILDNIMEEKAESELIKFFEFLKDERYSRLIITTRKYIYEDFLNKLDTRKNLIKYKPTVESLNNCIVNLTEYSSIAKEHILFNQIKYSNLSFNITKHLAKADIFYRITNKASFSPRIIEDFFKRAAGQNISGPGFVEMLLRYFDNPYEYWLEIFNAQKESYRYILLIMLASNAPIFLEDLLATFKNVCKYVELCRMGHESMEMEKALLELNELFIRVTTDDESKIIEFTNPSIKDFLLRFLHENASHYIEHLIQGATFYNQLFFAFSTKKGEEINDELENEELWDGTPLFGTQVTLKKDQIELLLNRILKDFNNLGYSQLRRRNALDSKVYEKRKKHEILAWKLLHLIDEFDPAIYPGVKDFIDQQIKSIAFWQNKKTGYIGEQNMEHLPKLLQRLMPHYKFNPDAIISAYFNNIHTIKELYGFERFEEIYPDQFALFLINNAKLIQKKVLAVFTCTVHLFTSDKTGNYRVDMSLFLDEDLATASEDYGLDPDNTIIENLELKIEQYLEETSAIEDSLHQSKPIKPKAQNPLGREENKAPNYKLLLPEKKHDLSHKEGLQYFQEISSDATKQYLPHIKENIEIFSPFLTSKRSIEFLADSCEVFGPAKVFQSESALYYKHFEYIYYEFDRRSEITTSTENQIFINAVLGYLYIKDQYIKRLTIEDIVNDCCTELNIHLKDRIIDVLFEKDFLFEKNGDWYLYSFRAQLPFLLSMALPTIDQSIKPQIYNLYLPKKFYWNVEAPRFWRFCPMLDKSFFIQHILLKQLINFVTYIKIQPDADSIASILRYITVKLHFRLTKDYPSHSYDVWKIETPQREFLCVLDFLGAKLDFRLLSSWFKKAFESKGDFRQTHNTIVNYIESFYKKFSFTLDPSPVDEKYTAYYIFPLESSLKNEAFSSIIEETLFPGKAKGLVDFCKNKIEELELELFRNN